MEIKSGKRCNFWGYITPLRLLEQAFQTVGMDVDFSLEFDSRTKSKTLEIKRWRGSHRISLDSLPPDYAVVEAALYSISGFKEKKNG